MLDVLQGSNLFTAIGIFGAATYVLNYSMLSLGWHSSDSPRYYALNILAACGVMASLAAHFNLPTLLIQGFYLGMSIWAIARRLARLRPRPPATPVQHVIHLRHTPDWTRARRSYSAQRRRNVR